LQIFATEGDAYSGSNGSALASGSADVWQSRMADAAWVVTPDDLVAAGLWAPMSNDVRLRVGELIIVPRDDDALYDARTPGAEARNMVGQHGGLSEREMTIPWMRLTAAS
jgi:hypothetical protein